MNELLRRIDEKDYLTEREHREFLNQLEEKLNELKFLKSLIEVVPQYKYTGLNTFTIRIKQSLMYNDEFALLVKSIVENKELEELQKEFPILNKGVMNNEILYNSNK